MALSRIGKQPITIPASVDVDIKGLTVSVKGPKGVLEKTFRDVGIKQEDNQILVSQQGNGKTAKAFHGLARALLQNLVIGVSEGFKRELEINGVGYRAAINSGVLELNLGFSHPINYPIPAGIDATVDKQKITLQGADKELLGRVAAKIRGFRPPEPYKGKGIKYSDEVIRRKAGKTAAG